jgi:hypothetical protein
MISFCLPYIYTDQTADLLLSKKKRMDLYEICLHLFELEEAFFMNSPGDLGYSRTYVAAAARM